MTSNPFEAPSALDVPNANASNEPPTGRFDIGEVLSIGWETTKQYFWVWLGVFFVGGLIMGLSMVALVIPALVVAPAVTWGFYKFGHNALRGNASFDDLFDGFRNFGDAVGGFLIMGLLNIAVLLPFYAVQGIGLALDSAALAGIGQILVQIASIFITIRWMFAPHYIVDRRMGAMDAIKASWAATSTQPWLILLFLIVSWLLALAGTIALVVGVFPAMAVIFFASCAMYHRVVGLVD